MDIKDDWDEIEKFEEMRKQTLRDQYHGADILNLAEETKSTRKKIDKFNHVSNKVLKVLAILYIIFLILFIFIVLNIYVFKLKSVKNSVDIDVVQSLKDFYGIDTNILSSDLDSKGNGHFHLVTKGKEKIEFDAEKKFGSYESNYKDLSLKYFYNKWNSPYKDIFQIESGTSDNGLETFTLLAPISDVSDIDNVMNIYMDLKSISGKYYTSQWPVQLYYNNQKHDLIVSYYNNISIETLIDSVKKEIINNSV